MEQKHGAALSSVHLSSLIVAHYKMFIEHNMGLATYLGKLTNFFVWTVAIPKAEFVSDMVHF